MENDSKDMKRIEAQIESLKIQQSELQKLSLTTKNKIETINSNIKVLVNNIVELSHEMLVINQQLNKNMTLINHLDELWSKIKTSNSSDLDSLPKSKLSMGVTSILDSIDAFLFSPNVDDKVKPYLSNEQQSSKDFPLLENPIILRNITKYNWSYSAYEAFERSCVKNDVKVYRNTNLYTLLLSLRRKKLHFVLEKDGYEQFCPIENLYQGSEEWSNKWNRIAFSSSISSEDFLLSLEYIFKEHGIETISHPRYDKLVNFNQWKMNSQLQLDERNKNELIANHNNFIYIGLYLMHYKISISNTEESDDTVVSCFDDIKCRNNLNIDLFNAERIDDVRLKLNDCCNILRPLATKDCDISENIDDLLIVFSEDIISNNPTLRYHSYINEEENLIVNNDIVLCKKYLGNISLWNGGICHASDEVIVLKGINNNISQEFLFLYLRTLFMYYTSLGYKYITNTYKLYDLEITIPSKVIQKEVVAAFRKDPSINFMDFFKKNFPNFSDVLKKMENYVSMELDSSNNGTITSSYPSYSYGLEYVKGHYRKGGIYVRGHYRRK